MERLLEELGDLIKSPDLIAIAVLSLILGGGTDRARSGVFFSGWIGTPSEFPLIWNENPVQDVLESVQDKLRSADCLPWSEL